MLNGKKLLAFILTAAILAAPAYAFRSVKFESYTDPDYKDYRPQKVVLLVANTSNEIRTQIEERMADGFAKRGVTVISYRRLFPPTRTWAKEDQLAIYEREGVDSGLIVTAGASASSVIPVATQTYSSATVFGSYGSQGTFNATGSGTSTTYNIMSAKSVAEFSAVLLDLKQNRTAWYVDVTTKAGGTLFVSEKGDAKALVKGVVDALESDGHVPKK
jgi:hypothetical protein